MATKQAQVKIVKLDLMANLITGKGNE